MANKNTTRKGSGRTKGAFSFVLIPLKDIKGKFADDSTPIKVSRLWAQECGFTGLTTAAANELTQQTLGQTPTTKVGVKETELE